MPIRRNHGHERPENFHPAALPPAVPAAPERDPRSGQFVKGNRAGARRAALARLRRGLMGIDPGAADPWIASYVRDGQRHCARLIAELPPGARGAMLDALAEETAAASTVTRALLNLAASAADPNERATLLREARSWSHQARSGALALAGLSRQNAQGDTGDGAGLGWLEVTPIDGDAGAVPDDDAQGGARAAKDAERDSRHAEIADASREPPSAFSERPGYGS